LIARFESSSLPASRAIVAAVAVAAFLVSWVLLHQGFYERDQIVDTPIYERYGEAMVDGEVPYRDFTLEYPPASLPVFVLPALGNGDFRERFEGLMAACGVALILVLVAMGAWAALPLVAVAPLLLGSVTLTRFDLWPALLTAAALALLVGGRFRFAAGVLGLATAAKLYPAVLLPILVAHVWRSRDRREALLCVTLLAAVVAAIVLPFAVIAPGGVWDSVWRQAGRPLQIESLGSGLLLGAHHLFGLDLTMESSHGSQNFAGSSAGVIAVLTTIVQLATLLAIWVWHTRGPASPDRAIRASAAAVCAFVVFGKVLSPQFLIWLIALVPLVRGRRGLLASGVLAGALVLTQLWFPYRYWELALEFDPVASGLVLVRDLTLLGLLGVLTLPARAGRARSS